MRRLVALAIGMVICSVGFSASDGATTTTRWSAEKARQWYEGQPWLVGCNYIPATAVNQLEMWQAETFDLSTIEKELSLARQLGFTSVRVFLHDLLWKQDSAGFLKRIDQFLHVAEKNGIGVMLVLFDSCWNPLPKPGSQPEPLPHIHNSQWVQGPGAEILKNPSRYDELRDYVLGVVGRFGKDKRVQMWDVHNEPDMVPPMYKDVEVPAKAEAVLALMRKTFPWVREANPIQPLTSGVWSGSWADPAALSSMARFQLENSDIISFHTYGGPEKTRECVESLRQYGRPLVCTEYMARPSGSTFDPILGYFQEQNVGAYNWGLVAGKSQTQYPWDSWDKKYEKEPDLWFCEIFRGDHTPYKPEEMEYIKTITRRASGNSSHTTSSADLK